MKKLLLIAAIALCFTSCNSMPQVSNEGRLPVDIIKHFEYNGHSYIYFRDGELQCSVGGFVHDPDCKCNIKNRQE